LKSFSPIFEKTQDVNVADWFSLGSFVDKVAGETFQMALVRRSARILVDKVTLFTKLELFNKNPAQLVLREYEVRSDASSSVPSTFIDLIYGRELGIRDGEVEGLGYLAAELGHAGLAAACWAWRSPVVCLADG
jgi:hypothetical protein